jgi:hypothetical protein
MKSGSREGVPSHCSCSCPCSLSLFFPYSNTLTSPYPHPQTPKNHPPAAPLPTLPATRSCKRQPNGNSTNEKMALDYFTQFTIFGYSLDFYNALPFHNLLPFQDRQAFHNPANKIPLPCSFLPYPCSLIPAQNNHTKIGR